MKIKMTKQKSPITLGCMGKDLVTSYEGVVVAWTEWAYGCDRVVLQAQEMHNGKPVDSWGCDVQHVQLTKTREEMGFEEPLRTPAHDIPLGSKCKDTITGFEGILVARTTWLSGTVRLTLQPKKLHDGKPVDNDTFDSEQVEVLQVKEPPQAKVLPANAEKPGGPRPAPIRSKDPR
jgi:hypothetical protein